MLRQIPQNINRCLLRQMDFLIVPTEKEQTCVDAIALYGHPRPFRAFEDIHVPKSLALSGTIRKSHFPT